MSKRQPLEVKSRRDLVAVADMNGAALSIFDCQSLDRTRMAMTLEIVGTPEAVQGTISSLRTMVGVGQAYEVPSDSPRTRVFMTLDKPRICQASEGGAVLCADCPFDSAEIPTRWKLDFRRAGDTGQLVARLAEQEVQAGTNLISPVDRSVRLTPKERGIVAVAIERGYFEFPRRITLEELSQLVGIEIAALRKTFLSLE